MLRISRHAHLAFFRHSRRPWSASTSFVPTLTSSVNFDCLTVSFCNAIAGSFLDVLHNPYVKCVLASVSLFGPGKGIIQSLAMFI